MYVISKGWITSHWRWHPSDSEQLRSVPRTQPAFRGTVDPSRYSVKTTEGARHERHDLEGGTGEAGLDAAFGHRVGGGLFNRDYRARISVGKRSGVRPGFIARVQGARATGDRAHARRRLMPLMIADRRPLGRALTPIAAFGHRPSAPIAARRLSSQS